MRWRRKRASCDWDLHVAAISHETRVAREPCATRDGHARRAPRDGRARRLVYAPLRMPGSPTESPLARFFRFVIARRWWVLAVYALILPPAILCAMRVGQDNALERLIVTSDPDYIATKEFEKVFGSGAYIVLLAQAPDIFAPDVLARVDALETRLAAIPGVEPQSALGAFRRARAGFTPSPEQAEAFRAFVTGTTLFREQGLVAEGILAIPVVLRASGERGVRG